MKISSKKELGYITRTCSTARSGSSDEDTPPVYMSI